MRPSITAAFLALSLGLCTPMVSWAEGDSHELWVGAHAGVVLFDEARDLTGEEGFSSPGGAPIFGLRGSARVPWLLVDAELDLNFLAGAFEDESSFQALTARGEFRYRFMQAQALQPFVSVGALLFAGFTEDFGSDTDLGFSAGGGLEVPLELGWALRIDARWLGGDGVEAAANDLEFVLGFGYRI